MPENTEFAVTYKKLLDRNFEPDPQRSAAALRTVLQTIFGNDPLPYHVKKSWKSVTVCDIIGKERKKKTMPLKNETKASAVPVSPALTARARAGDQAAFTELYETTSPAIYRSVRSMVHDEDLAWDILQETYIRAFRSLDKLEANEAFLPWLRRIAVNETARATAARQPLCFSELSDEDEETLSELPDLRTENQPELSLDRQESARLVREILADLPEQQNVIVGMRYYEDLSIREIGELLTLTPGTVKTQLHRGRKHVEERVRALEKQGVKLYGLSPMAFLMALLRRLEPSVGAERTAMGTILANAPVAAGGAGASVTVTAMTAGQHLLHGLGAKLAAGALAVALIGGGIWAGSRALRQKEPETLGDHRPTEQMTEASTEAQTDPIQISTEPVETEPAVINPAVTESTVTEPAVTVPTQLCWPVDAETEAEIRALFDDPEKWYRHALTCEYADRADLDLNKFFYDFYTDPRSGEGALTDREREALLELLGEDAERVMSMDCAKFDDLEADTALAETFDMSSRDYVAARLETLARMLGEGWYCLPWKCYINFHSDSYLRPIEIQEILQDLDGHVFVNYRYDDGDFAEMTLVLEYDHWRYVVLANQKRADALENPAWARIPDDFMELAALERDLSGDRFECLLVGEHRYFSNGKTRIWTNRDMVIKMDVATGKLETLFSLDLGDEQEIKMFEEYGGLAIVTENRLYFEGGWECFSVDYQNQNRKAFGSHVYLLDRGNWDGMHSYMEGVVSARGLTVIDRDDNVILDVASWSHKVIDGSLYCLSAVFDENPKRPSHCELFQMDPDGSITVIGTIDETADYLATEYLVNWDTHEITTHSYSEDGGYSECRYDLFTLEKKE